MNKSANSLPVNCKNCGEIDSGIYCSNCGAELAEQQNELIALWDSLLEFGEIRKFSEIFLQLLSNPIMNTRRLFLLGNQKDASQFFKIGVAIYITLYFSREILIDNDILSNLVPTISILIFFTISLGLQYGFLSKYSNKNRSFREFVKLSMWASGFSFPVSTLALSINNLFFTIDPSSWLFHIFMPFSLILAMGVLYLNIYLFAYYIHIFRYFWNVDAGKIYIFSIISNVPGVIAQLISLYVMLNLISIANL